jgi:hypothetical protein
VFEIFVLTFSVEKAVLEISTVLIVFGEFSALTVELQSEIVPKNVYFLS